LITLNLEHLYHGTAKLSELPSYEASVKELAGNGNIVTLTGRAPVWLYLRVAHVLHGKVKTLLYDSPVTGEVVIFDHNPF
jgi:hypothetical protein